MRDQQILFLPKSLAYYGGYGKTWNATEKNATCGDYAFKILCYVTAYNAAYSVGSYR